LNEGLLSRRAFSFEEGILCIIDGSKGLRKAIDEVFGDRAEVQRCQWHKRKNVVSYLPKADQKTWRRKL
jgi:transposase-like protein